MAYARAFDDICEHFDMNKKRKTGKMTAQQAFWKARNDGWSQELEGVVVNSKDPEHAYYFAYDIKKSNISRLEQVVLDAGEPEWALYFAMDILGANILKLQQVVIDSGDFEYAFDFAYNIKGANISDLIDFVLINDPEWIKQLFRERPDLRHKYEIGK